jgi:type 1 glutamine amidotransferase
MRRLLAAVVLAAALVPAQADAAGRVLVLTRTEGFRHDSIPAALATVRAEARRRGLRVTATEDARTVTARRLRGMRAIVFLQTTGDVLDPPQERAVERFVRRGGGWLGVHAAADAERDWPFYANSLLGRAEFAGHPAIQRATVDVVDRSHPATRHLPRRWTRTDEWYAFRRPADAHVLARLDETTYDPGAQAMGRDHPVVWHRTPDRGRAFYTALGHTEASYREPAFRRHLGGALAWVAR